MLVLNTSVLSCICPLKLSHPLLRGQRGQKLLAQGLLVRSEAKEVRRELKIEPDTGETQLVQDQTKRQMLVQELEILTSVLDLKEESNNKELKLFLI